MKISYELRSGSGSVSVPEPGPEQNKLYFTGNFGFVIKEFKFETWFQIYELDCGDDFVMFPIKPEAIEFIDEFILWTEELDFDFGIHEKEDYEFKYEQKKFSVSGKLIVVTCDDAGVRHLTKYMEKFWKHECFGLDGDKAGFSGTEQYFKKDN